MKVFSRCGPSCSPNALTNYPVHRPLGSFGSLSRLGGELCFCGFVALWLGLGALCLGALSLGSFGSLSCLGGELCFCGFGAVWLGLGALCLGALSLGSFGSLS